MTRSLTSEILLELETTTDSGTQLILLRKLKNEIVGHDLHKRECIRHGIVSIISQILTPSKKKIEKRVDRDKGNKSLSQEELVFIQTTGIVAVISHGGPSFVQPMLHSKIIPNLLSALSSATNGHPKVVISILKCLNSIADRLPATSPTQWLQDKQLATFLYSSPYIQSLAQIISNAKSSGPGQRACSLVIALVCKTCTEEKQKRALIDAEFLTALSNRFAAILVSEGFVLPGDEASNMDSSTFRPLPPSAPSTAQLSPVLQAISLLIEQSTKRATMFLSSPVIASVLPGTLEWSVPSDGRRVWGVPFSATVVSRSKNHTPIESLLPSIPPGVATLSAIEQSNFPPLGLATSQIKRRPSFLPTHKESPSENLYMLEEPREEEDDESPVIALLIHLVRSGSGTRRLMAAKVLISLSNLGFVQQSRLDAFSMLLVPVLVRMIDEEPEFSYSDFEDYDQGTTAQQLKSQTPAILASLIMDDSNLQRAAVEAGAIKKISQALKKTFDPVQINYSSIWTPNKSLDQSIASGVTPDRLEGDKAPDESLRRAMKYREGLLKALAAIAPFNDEYRKAICEQGVLQCIIDSLKPLSSLSEVNLNSKQSMSKIGNPAGTLLAACGVTRALTRSVTALRTNLIDAGIAPSVLQLLNSGDPEIKIAATKVVANLATDVSPMKETVSHPTVIKSLCEQAHSANPRLRFESIWALKQLVLYSQNSVKFAVIQELGPSWIKHLIQTDPADVPPGIVIGMMDMEYPPRPNSRAIQTFEMDDVVMGEASERAEGFKFDKNNREDLKSLGQEENPYHHTVKDDIAIQEQLLDFIRNLFCGEKANEIIEYIFGEMGEADFFEIMHSRLRAKVIPGATRKENKIIPPPTETITKVLYVLVHVAASLSKYRDLVASNAPLLRQILQYINHTSSEIRAQCCWVAINLTYEDDPSDRAACKRRAVELQRAGYLPKLEAMREDMNLDVRERTKTAVHLMRQLLDS